MGGDDRFYNNIFVGNDGLEDVGTAHYNEYTTSLEEYIDTVQQKSGDHEKFHSVEQPVYINHNAYFNGASAFEREKENIVESHFDPKVKIEEEGNEVYLTFILPENFESILGDIQTTEKLRKVRIVDADFENPNGSEVILDTDYLDQHRSGKIQLGPIANLQKGENRVKVWG